MKQKNFLFAILFSLGVTGLHAQKPKGDPWIFQAYQELYYRQPNAWELNIRNYGDGSWKNYGELKSYIQQYQNSQKFQGLSVRTINLSNGQVAALFNKDGRAVAVDLITNDGGSIVASGAGNIVASGAGNIVTNASGNITGLLGVYFGPSSTKVLVSGPGAGVYKTSGSGALIIK